MMSVDRFCAIAGALLCFAQVLHAQTIATDPAEPTSASALTLDFIQPFDCAAPQPTLTSWSGDALVFESVLPYGVVHCPAIPAPPPQTSRFEVPLGTLAAGTYRATWNIYRAQPSGAPQRLSTASASFTVAEVRPAGAQVAFTPTLSTWTLCALAVLCALAALPTLRRTNR
jgi:hypothetical protein